MEAWRGGRKVLGWTQERLAEEVGVSRMTIARIESNQGVSTGNLQAVLAVLDRAEGHIGQLEDEERSHLEAWRRLPVSVREHLEAVVEQLGWGSRAKREESRRMLPCLGYVAARDETAAVDFAATDAPLSEHDVPEDLWGEGRCIVGVRGGSMVSEDIREGDLLVVQFAELGEYSRGQVVIAQTSHGQVVKKYGGQRRGVITLESCAPGAPPIRERKADEPGGEGVTVQAVVVGRIRPPRKG